MLRLLLVLPLILAGCLTVRPQAREHLAQPAMQEPLWPNVARGDAHTFEVREGTGGATADGGGGCGCN